MENDSQKLVEEFQYLLNKSQKLFSGLRDLPPTGGYKQWHPYFQRTFEIYTKLWKFQQQHRHVLENKDSYGLKRWEIGEIASKIGQLYYHYYLRTSETSYLHESYVFYEAIHERNYFAEVFQTKSANLAIKKLRYYARFIVVSLLLNKKNIVKILTESLSEAVYNYTKIFKPNDATEWQIVLQEIAVFTEADQKLLPMDLEYFRGRYISHSSTPPSSDKEKSKLKLQEAILIGNRHDQIKFSELTLDIYRVLQMLEREPPTGKDGEEKEQFDKLVSKKPNPRKYLLYRPTFSQLMVFLASSFKELFDNSVLLLYISSDGVFPSPDTSSNSSNASNLPSLLFQKGGVAMGVRKGDYSSPNYDLQGDQNCLYPSDLFTLLRRPFFLIVDSNNSTAFKEIPSLYGHPFACLLSPVEYPPSTKDCREVGNVFTLFLYSPLLAICFVSNVPHVSSEDWTNCSQKIVEIEIHLEQALKNCETLDRTHQKFVEEEFLGLILIRYILCETFLKLHSHFVEEKNFPSIFPPMPKTLLKDEILVSKILSITEILSVQSLFRSSPL